MTLPELRVPRTGPPRKRLHPKSVFEHRQQPGENCPANSIYGHAKADTPLLEEPLEGPVFLRTGYGTKLPDLVAALNNKQIHIDLAGNIDSVHKKGTEVSPDPQHLRTGARRAGLPGSSWK